MGLADDNFCNRTLHRNIANIIVSRIKRYKALALTKTKVRDDRKNGIHVATLSAKQTAIVPMSTILGRCLARQ